MSRSGRLLAIAGTLVVLVIAFIVLSPGDEDDTATTTTSTATTVATPASTTPAPPPPPPPPPAAPKPATVVVRAGKPAGGVKRIEVRKGSRVRIEVSSPDTSDEIHLHGYDLTRDLTAGGTVRFVFTAKDDGIYEMELEGAHTPIAELVVEP